MAIENKLICIVGMAGSGKSIVSDELKKRSFAYLRFGQIVLDELKKRGLEVNEANEKIVREKIRQEYGMSAFAVLNIPKIDDLLKKSNVVADGLYSWSEYKILKEKYGETMTVLAVYSPPQLRYERLADRKAKNDSAQRFRPLSKEEAEARDFSEIENIEKGGPIAMADFTLNNVGALQNIKENLDNILAEIK